MRFNDRQQTVVRLAASPQLAAREAAYLQLVDMLADGLLHDQSALTLLADLHAEVDADLRGIAARSLSGRRIPFAVVALFGEEPLPLLSPLLKAADLAADEWRQLIPALPPPARALIAERRDLPEAARRALEAMGPAAILLDAPAQSTATATMQASPAAEGAGSAAARLFVPAPELNDIPSEPRAGAAAPDDAPAEATPAGPAPPDPAPTDPAIADGEAQLRTLLARIQRFRDARAHTASEAAGIGSLVDWGWETDVYGRIVGGSGLARVHVGQTLTAIAVDNPRLAQALGRRASFRDLDVGISGARGAAQRWMLSGVPYFDARDGAFQGFRGTARAVEPAATPAQPPAATGAGLFATGASAEKLATMAHEVRTPLNAILGFAQMIEGELLGPAGAEYRERAQAILEHSERLLAALDDLTDAARIARGTFETDARRLDVAQLMARMVERYRPLAARRGATVELLQPPGLPQPWTDTRVIERALSRLMSALLANMVAGEVLRLSLRGEGADWLRIHLARPSMLLGRSAEALFDPALGLSSGETADAPLLGLGFSLRLVRQLAHAVGGRFEVEPHGFVLLLPPIAKAARAS